MLGALPRATRNGRDLELLLGLLLVVWDDGALPHDRGGQHVVQVRMDVGEAACRTARGLTGDCRTFIQPGKFCVRRSVRSLAVGHKCEVAGQCFADPIAALARISFLPKDGRCSMILAAAARLSFGSSRSFARRWALLRLLTSMSETINKTYVKLLDDALIALEIGRRKYLVVVQ